MTRCILGSFAPRLLVPHWIDEAGQPRPPLTLTELGSRHRILLFYQHSCPGCHLHGFPTLLALIARMASNDVGFAVVQTVFERVDVNTSDQLIDDQNRYGLRIPFGHDTIASDGRYPTTMVNYRTAGTPWFVVIDPAGTVIESDFSIEADRLLTVFAKRS